MVKFYKLYGIRLAAWAIFLFTAAQISGQTVIKGMVKDSETKEGLIGAFVTAKQDETVGTSTDFDGSFEITVPAGTKTLVFSYTGYTDVEENIDGRDYIEVVMSAGQVLESIVVIGYGTVKREDATGSIQAVNSKDFNRGAITSPQELLAGKVAGVAITTTGGGPDDGVQIRVRGQSSLSASNDPLIVIDGIPIENTSVSGNRNLLNIINPNDIETMTVLKDASATAIYGSRASAGVIMITTKKGSLGAPFKVGYNANVSVGQTFNRVDVLSAEEYRATLMNYYGPDHPSIALMGNANTDWQDQIYQNALGTDHNLNVSGSIGKFPLRASVGYTFKEGLLKSDQFQRYSGSLNVNPKFLDNTLQVNLGVKANLNKNQFADRGAIGSALSWDPTQTPFDSTSVYSGYTAWLQPDGNPNGLAPANPVAMLDKNLRNDYSDVSRVITSATLDYRFPFLKNLRANLNLAYDYSNGKGKVIVPGNNVVAHSFNALTGGGVNNSYEQVRTNSLLEFYLNYKKDIGDHSLDGMAGYSWQKFADSRDFVNSNAAGTPSETLRRDSVGGELYLVSLFGRVNYAYKDRYLLTVSLRGDATSRYSASNPWGLFPAVAFATKIFANENKYFNSLKGRLGWGVTGQQDLGSYYVSQPLYRYGLSNANYIFGEEYYITLRPDPYDSNIKWESTTTYNLGIDYSIIKGRLSGSLDLYQRNTKDLLNRITVAAGTNLSDFIDTNVGNMVNKGVELAVNSTPISKKDFTWDVSFNIAYNTNKITKLTLIDDPDYIGVATGDISGGVGSRIQIHTVGYQPASFFVYKQLYDENGKLLEGQFEDMNDDGIINELDKYWYKKPAADVIGGITSNLKYKNFDFSFAGRANFGNYVYNNVATDMGYFARLYHSTNYLQNIHRAGLENEIVLQNNATFSDHYVTDASFFRLDHITMGYSFENLIGKFFRIYATVQNPFVITKYDGLDPEISNGIDRNVYPRPRTYVFGLSLDF